MASSDILRQMINAAPDQVDNINNSIGQIDSLIDDLDEQIDALENGMCAVTEADLTDYLNNTKLSEIESLYGTPFNTPFTVMYGSDYGKVDYDDGGITDWTIVDSSGNVEYEYNGANWDSDSDITKWINDYAFANDYLTRPLTSGASYGLKPSRSNYATAKALLQDNADKVADSETALEDYAS